LPRKVGRLKGGWLDPVPDAFPYARRSFPRVRKEGRAEKGCSKLFNFDLDTKNATKRGTCAFHSEGGTIVGSGGRSLEGEDDGHTSLRRKLGEGRSTENRIRDLFVKTYPMAKGQAGEEVR